MKERIVRSAKVALATVFSVAALIAEAVTTVYVDDDSTNPVSPYNTPETAAKTITDAMVVAKELSASDTVVVSVAAGEYSVPKLDANGTCYALDAAISVVGETGNPADVVLHDNVAAAHPDYRHVRAFELNHPDARVEALTIDGRGYGGGAQIGGVQGGHILLSDGTVENCVVSGGSLNSGGASETSHGANVALTGGRLVRCQILNGVLNRNANYGGAGNGSGVYAAGGTVESCLISQCTCSGYTQAALYLGGAAVAVNCTVVDNAANGNHPTAGVQIGSTNAKAVNMVITRNGGTLDSEFGTANRANYLSCASSAENTESGSCRVIDDSVFENAGAGNYHLVAKQGGLVDAGTEKGLPEEMSAFDLDGKDRVSGETIDIGCYELQQKGLVVSGSLSKYGVLAGESLTCSASVVGAKGAVSYKWDFGNGDVKETEDADYGYAFPDGGQFFVSVAASDDGGETWSDWVKLGTSIAVAPAVIYVDFLNESPEYPYATEETAATSIEMALSALTNNVSGGLACVDGARICVLPGEYTVPKLAAGGSLCILNAGVTISGKTGDPADVILHDNMGGQRAFELRHPGAKVEALTIDGSGRGGGSVQGGHVIIADGTMENCTVSGGSFSTGGGNASSGANVALTGGRLVRCQILNGSQQGIASWSYAKGSGVYASDGVVESCLISKCKCTGNYASAALYLEGTATAVNCTVVGNTSASTLEGFKAAGVSVESADAKVINTVIFNNGGTSEAEFGAKNLENYDTCASSVENAESGSCLVIDDSVFENAGAGNYHLVVKQGGLVDSGTEDGIPEEMSAFDLDGKDRVSGETIDIGCYELQQKGLVVSGSLSKYGVLAGESLICSASAMGAKGAVIYKWDFGNGDVKETEDADYGYAFPDGGQFFAKVAASDDGGQTWSDWVQLGTSIAVAPAVIYVDFRNESPDAPYATEETAATSIEMALSALTNNVSGGLACVDGARICILPGEYTVPKLAAGGSLCILNAGVTISGKTGDPADVTIHDNMGGQRAFELRHQGAKIEALTIDGAGYKSGQVQGGHILITDGTVENCIISGGSFPTGGGFASSGANVALTGGRLVRCQILNGSQQGAASWSYAKGSGVYASDGVVESCLISKCKCTGDYASAALYLEGTATAVNCTVVGNTSASTLEGFKAAGVSVESAGAKVINTVIFNNGGTSEAEFGTKNLANYDTCASSVENAASESCLVIDGSMFEDAANEDYRPAIKQGGLVDAGAEEGLPEGMSEFDLDGNDRVSGKAIDIGCYELPQGEFTFTCAVAKYGALENEPVACSSGCAGAKGEVLYKWDFGNGDVVTTADETFEHAYPNSGLFVIRVAASDDGGTSWTDWTVMPTKIVVAPRVMYVDSKSASPAYPYSDKTIAATSLTMALSALTNNASGGLACVDGVEIRMITGEYRVDKLTTPATCWILNAAITVVGDTGNPADVIIHDDVSGKYPDYLHVRAFELNHSGARLAAVTIDGSGFGNGGTAGGHVVLTDGTVENCIIRGGTFSTGGGSGSDGGNVKMSGGQLVRCQISDGKLQGAATWATARGAGVYATGGTVENCLIRGCTCSGTGMLAALYLGGTATAVNCTVVGNSTTVNPTAGVWIEGADAKVVNTVIFGNGGTSEAELGTKNLANYIYSASSVENAGASGWQVIDESAFRNYAGAAENIKGLRPRASGPLVATGSTREEYQTFGATATLDLLGKPRFVGKRLDIGCFEVGLKGLMLLVK